MANLVMALRPKHVFTKICGQCDSRVEIYYCSMVIRLAEARVPKAATVEKL